MSIVWTSEDLIPGMKDKYEPIWNQLSKNTSKNVWKPIKKYQDTYIIHLSKEYFIGTDENHAHVTKIVKNHVLK